MNTIYLKTAKAEREGTKLSTELRRVLSFLDGRSGSDDLAKRAAPSLRTIWDEVINELVKGGYIVAGPRARLEPKNRPAHKSGGVNDLAVQKLRETERVIAALQAAAAADKERSEAAAARVVAALEAAAASDKAKSDPGVKAKGDITQKVERAARAAELKSFFAAAREKAAAEIRQPEPKALQVRDNMQTAATAAQKLSTEPKPNAKPKEREQKNARTYVELETAIQAAKARSDDAEKSRSELKSKLGMHASDAPRVHELEIENEALKKLLVDAYMEIAALKAASTKST